MKSHQQEGWNVPASRIARDTHNPIRAIVENLNLNPNPDKPMIALSIGDPTVFGNLSPPAEVIDALCESVESLRYNGYAPSVGYEEARNSVAEYSSINGLQVTAKDVILCSGCSCSLDLCITVLANPGQNILVPRPGFSIYRTLAEGLGVQVKYYDLLPTRQWEADLAQLEAAIDTRTAAIIVNNPSNPCGSVYSREHLSAIIEIAEQNRVPIIADEIYEHFVFQGHTFEPLASLSKNVPILSCSGLTKRFLVPGWRMGWIIVHDRNGVFEKEVRSGLQRLSQRIIGSNTIVQGAIPKILATTPQEFFDRTVQHVEKNAKLAFEALRQIEGLTPVMPQGAMYMMVGLDLEKFPLFPTEIQFVEQLVTEESVFCLPGKCFDYNGYIRLVLTVPSEILIEACNRIELFCQRHLHLPLEEDASLDGLEKHLSMEQDSSDLCPVLPVPSVPVTLGEDRRP
ncbi:tyrosine aminotransferase [Neocloeon triangulifer]|uniref:tyrosine aminotransferase n=1 Tax=Neocloeon triangulifer TaxID=2078957 RepID=UPI00286F2E44|nr:tyrosine aminotransferase [Neocloeon triangulifer]